MLGFQRQRKAINDAVDEKDFKLVSLQLFYFLGKYSAMPGCYIHHLLVNFTLSHKKLILMWKLRFARKCTFHIPQLH